MKNTKEEKHFLSVLTVAFFLFIAYGSFDEKNSNTNSTIDSVNDSAWLQSPYIDTLLSNLAQCYSYGTKMVSESGNELDITIQEGNYYYNRAYQDFLKLQSIANYNIPKGKSEAISKALMFYSEIFNNRWAPGQNFQEELKQINKNIQGWPYSVSHFNQLKDVKSDSKSKSPQVADTTLQTIIPSENADTLSIDDKKKKGFFKNIFGKKDNKKTD